MSDDAPDTPSRIPTQPAMNAVAPPSIEERVRRIEERFDALQNERSELLTEFRAEFAAIKRDIASGDTKREALETRLTDLVTKVDSLTSAMAKQEQDMAAQTTMLTNIGATQTAIGTDVASIAKSVAGVFANPSVRKLAYSALASLAVILGILAAWLTGRAAAPLTPPTPAPVVTIYAPSAPTGPQ